MVHDPRVTGLLSRLGGLYRDPARVDRDASSLLKSSVGVHLSPGIAPLVENNGDSSHCLVLQGTIAIVFRGNTYQLLVDIYLPGGYPVRPPVSYVRLAPNMYLKSNHPHVGSDGMVYMPYTHEWNQRTHSLIEMVVAMSSVFSADPPVFTRATPAPPHPPPPADEPPAYSADIVAAASTSADSERYVREQAEAILAREAEEANRAAEAARRAAKEDEEKERKMESQKAWEEQKRQKVKEQVNQKIHVHLIELGQHIRNDVQTDSRDLQKLEKNRDKISRDLEVLTETKRQLESQIGVVDSKTREIQEWLEEYRTTKNNGDSQEKKVDVDSLCQPASRIHSQMLELSAENAALTDALYFLDRGMYMGQLDCTSHLKSVRKMAKRQFLVRAHLLKINQVLHHGEGVEV